MLTKDLSICRYDFQNQRIIPDRLTVQEHGHYLSLAEQMLSVYRNGTGLRRRDLHRRVQALFDAEPDCPQRRIDAFCRLLDEESTFDVTGQRAAPALRRQVWRTAAGYHPLVERADGLFESTVADVRQRLSAAIGRPWPDIENDLFADIIEFHRLKELTGFPTPRSLLSRYNVAQVQATLFSAVSMELQVTADFKRIFSAIRMARLMHTITRTAVGRYLLQIDGPASVLRETRRYGVQMAKMLPTLLACQGWRLQAVIETRHGWKLKLQVSDADRLQSHLPATAEFDSSIESEFARKWGNEPRNGWTLHREADFLHHGQKTFVPDFVFQHADGRRMFLEIVGFWTPEYIASRLATHAVFAEAPILLAIHHDALPHFTDRMSASRIIPYKTALLVAPVLEALG